MVAAQSVSVSSLPQRHECEMPTATAPSAAAREAGSRIFRAARIASSTLPIFAAACATSVSERLRGVWLSRTSVMASESGMRDDLNACREIQWAEYYDEDGQVPYYVHMQSRATQSAIPEEYAAWK